VAVPVVEKRSFALLWVTRELHETVGGGSSYGQTRIRHRLLPELTLKHIGNQLQASCTLGVSFHLNYPW
jgi:hypothetical protein